jgi:hypothetical protein
MVNDFSLVILMFKMVLAEAPGGLMQRSSIYVRKVVPKWRCRWFFFGAPGLDGRALIGAGPLSEDMFKATCGSGTSRGHHGSSKEDAGNQGSAILAFEEFQICRFL